MISTCQATGFEKRIACASSAYAPNVCLCRVARSLMDPEGMPIHETLHAEQNTSRTRSVPNRGWLVSLLAVGAFWQLTGSKSAATAMSSTPRWKIWIFSCASAGQ